MTLAKILDRHPPGAAVAVRLVAFLTTIASAILIPVAIVGAASGHGSVQRALVITVVAVALTLATTFAARSLDPLRR